MKLELEQNDYTLITALALVLGLSLCFSKYFDYRKEMELARLKVTQGALLGKVGMHE